MRQLYVEFTGILGVQFVTHVNGRCIQFYRIPGTEKQIARIERDEDYRFLIANDPRIIPYAPSEEGLKLLAQIEAEQAAAAEKAARAEAVRQAKQTLQAAEMKRKRQLEAANDFMRKAGEARMAAEAFNGEIKQAEARLAVLIGKPQEAPPEPVAKEEPKAETPVKAKPRKRRKKK